jgi:hypothetical protein
LREAGGSNPMEVQVLSSAPFDSHSLVRDLVAHSILLAVLYMSQFQDPQSHYPTRYRSRFVATLIRGK